MFIGAIMTLSGTLVFILMFALDWTYIDRKALTICPYNRQSEKVSRIWIGRTALPCRYALVGSLRITRVTMIDASRGVNMFQDLPKIFFGFAALCGRYRYATRPRNDVRAPSVNMSVSSLMTFHSLTDQEEPLPPMKPIAASQ